MEARAWAHVGQSGASAGGRREMCSGKRRVSREPHSATRQRVVHCEPATSLPLRCFPFRFLTSVRFLLRDGPPSNEAALPKVPLDASQIVTVYQHQSDTHVAIRIATIVSRIELEQFGRVLSRRERHERAGHVTSISIAATASFIETVVSVVHASSAGFRRLPLLLLPPLLFLFTTIISHDSSLLSSSSP